MLWITGANGLLGSALAGEIKTGRQDVDIADLKAVRAFVQRNPGITHIINCAAFSQVDLAEEKKEQAFRDNVLGPENLAHAACEIGAKFVHLSTDYVFSGDLHRPLSETDPVNPCNHYGKTKLEGEKRVQAVMPECCILRTSWIFGFGGKNFVAKMVELLQTQDEIRVTSNQWGRPTYAPDLANAIDQIKDVSGLYQFANQGVTTKYEFAVLMREEALKLGMKVKTERIVPVPSSAFASPCRRPVYSAFDTSKIEGLLGKKPREWKEALREYLRRLLEGEGLALALPPKD